MTPAIPELSLGGRDIAFVRYDELPLAEIVPSPHQPRKAMDPLVLASLQESIQAVGILQRPRVREVGGAYELVFGHQRAEACRLLGHDRMPVEVIQCDDLTARRMTLHENIKSTRLHPIEHAEAICKFLDATLSHDPGYDDLPGDSAAARVHRVLTLLTTPGQDDAETANLRAFVDTKQDLIRQILKEMAGKEPKSFLAADVQLLQLPDELLTTTVEKGLKKGHARALGQLLAKEPEMYQEVLARGVRLHEGDEDSDFMPLERAPVASIRNLYNPKREEPREHDADSRYMPIGVPTRLAGGEEDDSAPWDDDGPLTSLSGLPLASLRDAHSALMALSGPEWASMITESPEGAGNDARRQWHQLRRLAADVLSSLGED